MKNRNPVTIITQGVRATLLLGSLLLWVASAPAQETQIDPVVVPEDQIQQGRNKGVETWEGTLFGQDSYKPGSYAQIEVVPNPGFEFEKWEGESIADSTQAKTFVQMEEHVSIKPFYKRIWNVIAAPDNKEAGKVEGSGDYPEGSEVTLTVEPNEGFKFLGWEGKGINEETKEELNTQITVEGDHDIVARFEQDGDGGGGGGGGGSDENQDQNDDQEQQDQQDSQDEQNQDPSESEQNEDPADQEEPSQESEDQSGEEEQPQEPEPGEEEPAEPEDGEDDQGDQDGEDEQQPQEPGGEEESPSQEVPGGGQPVPVQMTPEEAVRLLEAMEDGEKKLPLFIVQPPDKKDSKKDW